MNACHTNICEIVRRNRSYDIVVSSVQHQDADERLFAAKAIYPYSLTPHVDNLDRQAFDLGWDFATFGLEVPSTANLRFCEGYRAFRHGANKTVHRPDKYVRKWLQIRFGALCRNKPFSLDVTPDFLQSITPVSGICPITGQAFTFGECEPTDWSVDRANNARGYVRGNIIIVSVLANAAKSDKGLEEMHALAAGSQSVDGLTPSQWQKFALLVEPAFGDMDSDMNPIQVLCGQPIALGMPVSPIASFQVAISRAFIDTWDREKRKAAVSHIAAIAGFVVNSREQHKAMLKLAREVHRRSRHSHSYTDIWTTKRVQKRLHVLIETLGAPGMRRLSKLQETALGRLNLRLQFSPRSDD